MSVSHEQCVPAADALGRAFRFLGKRWTAVVLGHLSGVPAVSELERMLRGASLRITRPRVAVLAAVHDHPHADTHSLIGVVRSELGEVSQQAVYDVLQALTDAGLVRRIHPPGSVARYESRVGDN